jgi:hypothetical protein
MRPRLIETMRARGRLACVAWLALAGAAASGLAQLKSTVVPAPAAAATNGNFTVSGTVVNALTGEALRRASVSVLAEADGRAVESVLSDNNGHFALAGLAAAKYQLTASKRGFRTAYYDEHDEFSTAIVTGADQNTSGLTFRLTPGGIIRGAVTGDGGDPVDGARVMLFQKPRAHKLGERTAQVDATTTDDTGAYEFGNLPAGEYYVAVTAEPWYSLHRTSGAPGQATATDALAALDVAYPVTYFDSTTDEASATAITLAAGGVEEAQINLHAVPALHLMVAMARRPDGSMARPELRQSIFGAQISAESTGLFDPGHMRTAEFTGVAPGHYELAQGDPPRVVELDATTSQQIDPSLGTPTVEVSGSIKIAGGGAAQEGVTVTLESADGERQRDPMQSNAPRGAFHFPSVLPGKWIISVNGTGGRLSIASTTIHGTTHAGNAIAVGDKALEITLNVMESDLRVTGFARKEGKGFAGAMIVLAPKDLNSIRELARRDQSDSDGSFALPQVAPGQYTIVAIQDGWNLDWSRPEVIGRFLPRGTTVTVSDTPSKTIALQQPVTVQSP